MRWQPVLLAALAAVGLLAPSTAGARGCHEPNPNLPYWARARVMTVINDSVLLSGEQALKRGFACWGVRLIGRPALMLDAAERQIRTSGHRVAPLVVVGIGYNSLWGRHRENHTSWAARFDAQAERLIRTLRHAGAMQIIWVTLRRATRRTTRPSRWNELGLYAWYFPYVNERLRALDERRNRVVLADWSRAGARRDVTYDSIHLNDRGGRLMQRLISTTLHTEAHRQAQARRRSKATAAQGDPCANIKTGAPARRPGAPRPPLVIGDSSELLAVAPLVDLGLEANARGCRQAAAAVDILEQRKRAGTLPRVAVLGVGANGAVPQSELARGLRIMGKQGRLGLVTAPTPASSAQAMRVFHAHHPTRTILIDWAASGIPQGYGGDGTHIGYEGEAKLAAYIAAHVRPYIPPRTRVTFPRKLAAAKDCGALRTRGHRLQVFVIRGRDRVLCSYARRLERTRARGSRTFRWHDWRFLGRPPWKDVFVRGDNRVIIAARTPVRKPAAETHRPAS